jgi:fatty acid desaturase
MSSMVTARSAPVERTAADPQEQRAEMARRLPAFVQPFLTWLTALPAPGAAYVERTPMHHLAVAVAWSIGGIGSTVLAILAGGDLLLIVPFGMIATTAGMGVLQAVIYHHCSHGTVLKTRRGNRALGKLISLLLLIKDFDAYQKEHMLHHSPRKLLTTEDEFLDYLIRFVGVTPAMTQRQLRRGIGLSFVSPYFHCRFLLARISACLLSRDAVQNSIGIVAWGTGLWLAHWTGTLTLVAVVWLIPATVLFQIATTLRTLAEHRVPSPDLIAARDRAFVGMATAGVFAGAAVPQDASTPLDAAIDWAFWWGEMLTVHLFARVFVLVGDAPAHDYHHRRPGSRKWPSYIHERSRDEESGCAGFPVNYLSTLGLFRAIDENIASLAGAQRHLQRG